MQKNSSTTITIRPYRASDTADIISLFHAAVHTIARQDYSAEQCAAWAPEHLDPSMWESRLKNNHTFVAEHAGTIIGFADITDNGSLEHLYVHPNWQGGRVSLRLLKAIEQSARELGLQKITTHCSITAKIPAQRMGFVVLNEQTVTRKGVTLTNYVMEKKL